MNLLITKILPENLLTDEQYITNLPSLDKLMSSQKKKLILVKAPKGSGKTILISLFVKNSNIKYSYYKLDEEDDNLYIFLNYLVDSISRVSSGFETEIHELLQYFKIKFSKKQIISKDEIVNFSKGFINHIYSKITKEFYIVIDNFEFLLQYDWAKTFFDYFIENCPSNIHFIFVSTYKFPFDEVKLKLKKSFLELGLEDLRVDVRMLKEISKNNYGFEIPDFKAKEIIQKTDGWITGVHILLQSLTKKLSAEDNNDVNENMEYFFEKEILENLQAKYKDVLILSAIFENFTEKLLSHLFKNVNSAEVLEFVRDKYGFVIKKSKDESYEMLTFFRDFLNSKIQDLYSKEFLKKLYLRAAAFYKTEDNIEEQVKYLLKSEDYKKIIPALTQGLQMFSRKGDYGIVDKWLRKIPEQIFIEYPFLFFYKGLICKTFNVDFLKAIEFFDECIRNKRKVNEEYYIRAVCIKAEILIARGECQIANSLLFQPKLKNANPKRIPFIFYHLVILYYHKGDFEKVIKIAERALKLLLVKKNWEAMKLKQSIFTMLGNTYAMRGNYTKAINYYELSIENSGSDYNKVLSMVNYYYAAIFLGSFDILGEVKLKIEEHKLLIGLPQIKRFLDEMMLLKNFELGFNSETIKKANEIIELAVKINFLKLAEHAIITKCKVFFYSADFQSLNTCATETFNQSTDVIVFDKVKLNLFTYTISKNLRKLYECLKTLENIDSYEDLIFCLFRIAEVAIVLKKINEASDALQRVFVLSEEKQCYNCAIKEYLFKREIYDFAFKHKLQIKFVYTLQEEILKRKNYINNFRIFYDVRLSLFGVPRLYVRGNKIDDLLWKRKKFSLMFIFIILNGHTHITKDILMEEFFPEADKEYSDNIFHQFLSNMRSVLKINNNNINPEFISYRNKYFVINTDYVISSDYKDFFNYWKKADSMKNSNESKQKLLREIIELSEKEFMKGQYENWIEDLRETINLKKNKCVNLLIEILKSENNNHELVRFYEILLKNDSIKYEQFLELIILYYEMGETTKAKKKYFNMFNLFKSEIENNPANKSLRYIRQKLIC